MLVIMVKKNICDSIMVSGVATQCEPWIQSGLLLTNGPEFIAHC